MENKRVFLAALLLLSAIGIIAISMTMNAQFYGSFSQNLSERVTWVGMGILFDTSKLALALVASILLYKHHAFIGAGMCAIVWFALSFISLVAALGFFSVVNDHFEQNQLKASFQFKSLQQQHENQSAKLESLSSYSDKSELANIETKLATLQANLDDYMASTALNSKGRSAGTVESRVGNCEGNGYYHRTYCGKIKQFQRDITGLENETTKYSDYDRTANAVTTAMQNMGGLSSNSISTSAFHPLWKNLATLFDSTAQIQKTRFLALSALLLEILSSLLLVTFSKVWFQKKN